MPKSRHAPPAPVASRLWPSGGLHQWPSGAASDVHAHDRGHLLYAARGVLAVHVEAGSWIVPANRVAWIPAGVPHHHRAHGATELRVVFLPPSLARAAPADAAVFVLSDLAREALLTLTGARNYDATAGVLGRGARTRLLRVLLDELRQAPEHALHLPEPHDDRLQAVARLLHANPADARSLSELGASIGSSARTLSRLFPDELGMTFQKWRTQLRLQHALVLLAEGHDTTYVAHACGWAKASNFIAAFRTAVGITPGRYQRQ